MLCSSGQTATLIALLNLGEAGTHVVSASEIYGGTVNLFSVTLKKLGIEFTYIKQNNSEEETQML